MPDRSDDIYEPLVYRGREFVNIVNAAPDLGPRTVLVNGCSKTYAMTGWRIGYAAGPATLIGAMTRIQDQSTSNPTSIAQRAAVAALKGPRQTVDEMRTEFDRRRKRMVELLNGIDGIRCPEPHGAFYAFGAEGYLRLSFVTSMSQIEKGAERIAEFVKALA
jgi:aspartate aminotransferase